MHEQIDRDVRRLVATATTDALIRHVQELAGASYARGFRNGYYRREDAKARTVLWQCLRRGLRRLRQRVVRTLHHYATHRRVYHNSYDKK